MKRSLGRALLAAAAGASCVSSTADRASVSRHIEERTGTALPSPEAVEPFRQPPGVSLSDGLSQDEAVAIALFNNRRFAVSLSDLDLAQAALVEAGLIRNPLASVLFPWGPKQLEATVTWPLDFLVKRPRRMAAARSAGEEAEQRVVQAALDLARDVKTAYAELWLARERSRLGGDAAGVLGRIAELTVSRFNAGDISALEADVARADALGAQERAALSASEAVLARHRLALLLGLSGDEPLELAPAPEVRDPLPALEELLAQCAKTRAELRAAEIAAEAARKRVGVADADWLVFSGILDMNAQGKQGFEAGPGVSMELPLMPANRGSSARARAELERDVRRLREARQRVAQEVRSARQSVEDTRSAADRWREAVLPLLETQAERSEKAYRAGDVSYLFVLESQRRLLDGRLQAAEASAGARRAEAVLEQSLGTTLTRAGRGATSPEAH
jgi:cobalt-zinc-cadmium efflux system outer membrane protein